MRLMKEFEKDFAILQGRVDGLEARVGELEATQFSNTTKLKGVATFMIGTNSFGGDAKQGLADALRISGSTNSIQGFGEMRSTAAAAQSGATSFNYDMELKIDTSFTGKDPGLFCVQVISSNRHSLVRAMWV